MTDKTVRPDLKFRQGHEQPEAIVQGWRYHHLGIPTTTPRPGERYLERFGVHVCGFETSPYGIEWMRYEEGSPIHELIRTVPHLCFEVDNLEKELEGKELLGGDGISEPSEGTRCAMIVHNGAPVELIQFGKR